MWYNFEPNVRTIISFLKLLNVKVNPDTVNETLQNHPDWPSLLCISDSLSNWNIPNAAGKMDDSGIDQLPTPFLAYTMEIEFPLLIVANVSDSNIYFYKGGISKLYKISRCDFFKRFKGIYLLAEPQTTSGEPGYKKNRKRLLFKRLIPSLMVALLIFAPLFMVRKIIKSEALTPFNGASIYFQYFIFQAGIAIASLLLWYEIDQNNPLLKKICTGITKSNCSAILTGRQSKVFSWLSWSEVGFFYFVGGLITFLFSNELLFSIPIIGWLGILALPYIVFSIYYQMRVARQWCPLCIMVQILLLLGSINSILGNFLQPILTDSILNSVYIGFFYLFPILGWFSVKPYILRLQKENDLRRKYLRIKFNSQIFETLLVKQKLITHATEGLGIDLGNNAAKNTLVKVCNPFCGPCAQSHSKIDQLLANCPNLKIKIIFNAPVKKDLPHFKIVTHFLSAAKNESQATLMKLLDMWYNSSIKDYDSFAVNHLSTSKIINKPESRIEAMYNWCVNEKIRYTPTFFLNGHQLPDAYEIEDLKYFLLE